MKDKQLRKALKSSGFIEEDLDGSGYVYGKTSAEYLTIRINTAIKIAELTSNKLSLLLDYLGLEIAVIPPTSGKSVVRKQSKKK